MDVTTNPYVPGSGARPLVISGRTEHVSSWDAALIRAERRTQTRPTALFGLRGVGKTVLLNEFRDRAAARDWVTVKFEATSGESLPARLAHELYPVLRERSTTWRDSAAWRLAMQTFRSFRFGIDPQSGAVNLGFDLPETSTGRSESGDAELDLAELVHDLSSASREHGVGLAVLIDEAQDIPKDSLAPLLSVCHKASQDNWPFLVALAGLPSLPGVLADARSYAERLFTYLEVGPLLPSASSDALTGPAAKFDVAWEPAAELTVLRAAAGYPYFIQAYGSAAWNAEAGEHSISEHAARVALDLGRAELDRGFFRSRWQRATRQEREYLAAMAQDGNGPSRSADVADRMSKALNQLGPARANLIKKGLIYSPDHGLIAFTVPGMASFIAREQDTD